MDSDSKAPSYQWYPDKAMLDMRRLSWFAKGIYRELLDVIWMQYQKTCCIPDDDELIAAEIGAMIDDWKRAKLEIMHPSRPLLVLKSLTQETHGLFSKGLWKERQKQLAFREKQRDNGMKGGRPRKTQPNPSETQPITQTKAKKSFPTPSPSPIDSVRSEELSESNPPHPPAGGSIEGGAGRGVVLNLSLDDIPMPKRKSPSQMTETEKKRRKLSSNSPDMVRIGSWFGRRESTMWSVYEAEALKQIGDIPAEDMQAMEEYYAAKEHPTRPMFRRKSVDTLLNNWGGELDRARLWKEQQKPCPPQERSYDL